LGRNEDATHSAARVLRHYPLFEIDSYGNVFHNPDDRDKIVEGLRQAGLK
jgi:hypothetical protein